MSDPNRPYKSHLFNFVNRQSLRIRDRLGETFRHLRVAAEWSVQLLALPFHWLLRPQQWAGPKLGNGRSQPALSSRMEYLSDPPVDQPLEKILTAIEPWFELPDASVLTANLNDVKPDHSPRKKEIVLSSQFFQQIQQDLENPAPSQHLALPPAIAPQNPNPRPLGNLVSQIKNIFSPTKDLVIRGISCVIENRQLVLTTADNEILVSCPWSNKIFSTNLFGQKWLIIGMKDACNGQSPKKCLDLFRW